jgi:hypothetical protein
MMDMELKAATVEQPIESNGDGSAETNWKAEDRVPSAVATEASGRVETPAIGTASAFDGYKNEDGSYDTDKLLKDFAAERDRAAGLRKKLAEPKKLKPFAVSDLSISVPEEEQGTMADLVKTFNDAALSKDQAEKILSKLSEYVADETQLEKERDELYESELKKLGSEKDTIINGLKNFADTMVSNKVWDGPQRDTFANSIITADAAKMFYTALQNTDLIRSGTFASTTPAQRATPEYSDKVDMYKRAFEMSRNSKGEGEMELKRLDKLFGIK